MEDKPEYLYSMDKNGRSNIDIVLKNKDDLLVVQPMDRPEMKIKSINYYPDGQIKSIEYYPVEFSNPETFYNDKGDS